jgi:hypothetical protein
MLLQSIEGLKVILGGINANLSWPTIFSSVEDAEFRHLAPVLGAEFIEWLNTNQTTAEGETAELVRLLRHALGHYALVEAIPGLVARIGDGGIMENASQNAVPVRQWVLQNLEVSHAQKADVYLESALAYLERHREKFAVWNESEACTVHAGRILATAVQLGRYVAINGSRRAFLALQPYLVRVEDLLVGPMIGASTLAALKERMATNTTTPADRELLVRLRPAVAHLAVAEAAPEMAVNLAATGLVLLPDNMSVRAKLMATPAELSALSSKALSLGTRYLAEVKTYLATNATEYPDYVNNGTSATSTDQVVEVFDNRESRAFYVG